ncbi:MAG: hypothetical protein Q7S82_03485 [bacterium]|nr:hypothetical protein [bacterium]
MKSFEAGSSPEQIKPEGEKRPELLGGQEVFEVREVAQGPELKPDKAFAQERGVLERFNGRAKEVARVLLLATALATGAGAIEQAFAQERPTAEDVEKKKSPQERAIDILNILYNLPDNPIALNEAHNNAMKSQVARQLIFQFALEKKLGFPETGRTTGRVTVTRDDTRSVLKDLGAAGEVFADIQFGNKDGKTSSEEMEKFKEAVKSNPGLRGLQEMLREFLS